jgi:BlaI family penicillinase repressor
MAKRELPGVSPAETEILRLLMYLKSGTVQQVCDALPENRQIGYATVQTLLRRLEKKGYVGHEVQGKAHVFSPCIAREEVVSRSVRDFVNRLFGGDPMPLLLHLVGSNKLKPKDIDRLKQLIENPEKDKEGGR